MFIVSKGPSKGEETGLGKGPRKGEETGLGKGPSKGEETGLGKSWLEKCFLFFSGYLW
jgi:hypothetical protein